MSTLPKAPATHGAFVTRYPQLGEAWELIASEGKKGPLNDRTARLVKLGIAIGAMREGAVHSSVRKASGMGIEREALEQVVALSASTLGMPATVAAFTWVEEVIDSNKN